MKVLLLSPEKKDKLSRQRRKLVVRALEGLKTKLVNPIPGRPPEKKTFPPSLFPQIVYKEETELLDQADLIIADLTALDFKTGFLVSRALSFQKTVLGLFWQSFSQPQVTNNWQSNDLFFVECFNEENIRFVLRNFLGFLRKQKKRKGNLVVIDGTDGSGKATQAELLVKYLKKKGRPVKTIDFPRYYSSFHGGMVGRYLKGEFGGLKDVNPYLASLTYALDRLTAKQELDDWLTKGNIVVANRYTSSNMAFQTVRVEKKEEERFLNWLIEMEYKVHKLPKEDIVIFLHVPADIGQQLVDKKNKKSRAYARGKKRDINESNLEYLKKAEKKYLELVKKFDHWVRINCLDKDNKLLSIKEIHQKVVRALEKKGVLKSD